jgi:ATPase subunit of ABC transporter with duplicated ATPase domains
MISAQGVSLQFGGRPLFQNVDVQFTPGNCYGLIGANGTGKSTFLRILSGELEPSRGEIAVTPGERIAVLRQDHYRFDEYTALQTVIMGYSASTR